MRCIPSNFAREVAQNLNVLEENCLSDDVNFCRIFCILTDFFKPVLPQKKQAEFLTLWCSVVSQDPRQHWQGHREGLSVHLPSARCLCPQGEDAQEAQV